jgi:hypothetical protein
LTVPLAYRNALRGTLGGSSGIADNGATTSKHLDQAAVAPSSVLEQPQSAAPKRQSFY